MLEHLIHVNTWFPKYEADLAEQTYYTVFVSSTPSSPLATLSSDLEPKVQPSPKPKGRTGGPGKANRRCALPPA